MVKKIDSDALGILTKSLGLTGAGSPVTELQDGVVDQSLDIAPIVRRSRTQGVTTGIYYGIMDNVHTDSETLTTSVFPYNVTVGAQAPYPVPMPLQFDIWLLAASVFRASGAGTLTGSLQLLGNTSRQGWGVDDGGAATGLVTNIQAIALWDTLIGSGITFGRMALNGRPMWMQSFRLPRGTATELRFVSLSSLTATFRCIVTLGVFPVALGQDGVV